MAKGYWIVRVSVPDQARYPEYLAAAAPAFRKFGAKFVVRGGAFETMEGTSRDRLYHFWKKAVTRSFDWVE